MGNNFSINKTYLSTFLIFFLASFVSTFICDTILFSITPNVYAAFSAGKSPRRVATVEGLSAEIPLSSYKFSPDFYTVGQTVSLKIHIFNPQGNATVSKTVYLYLSKVTESPKNTNVSDGTPTTAGIHENNLNSNHQAHNDVQVAKANYTVGILNVAPGSETVMLYGFVPPEVGYYQFDFSTLAPNDSYQPGHILGAGFIRVINVQVTPVITPTTTPVVTATPTAIPTGSLRRINTANSEGQVLGLSTGNTSAKVVNPLIQSLLSSTEPGEVLGAKDNFNPLVKGLEESLIGDVLGASSLPLTGLDDYIATNEKLPSGNTLIENSSIIIPAINVSSSIYAPTQVGNILPVGDKEILKTNNIFYGHNENGVLGLISKLHYDDKIYIQKDGKILTYSARSMLKLDEDDSSILNNTEEGVIYLLTCDTVNLHKRVVIKAQLSVE